MERWLLILLIILVSFSVYVLERVLPQFSALVLLLSILFVYGILITIGMLHQKRKARKYPKPPAHPGTATYRPSISIVIPAHNEAMVIGNSVTQLFALNYPDFDILVMDDRSTDKTADVLRALQAEYAEKYPGKFHYYTRPADAFPGKSAVLNDALRHTRGEVICVFDADARMDPDFLLNIVPFLADQSDQKADQKIGAVQARKVIENENYNWLTRCQNFEYSLDSQFQAGRDSIKGAVELRGNGELIKREALLDVKGWNNVTLTDDLDLSTRLHLAGWDVRFAHKVLVFEEGITQFQPLIRQRRRWAEGTIVRYLGYSVPILMSEETALRTKIDMVAYIIQFLFPIVLASDYGVQLWDYLLHDHVTRVHLITALITLPVLSTFFTINLVIAIIRFNKLPVLEALWGAIMTGVYMVILWIPVVVGVMIKMIFRTKNTLDWGKTDHFGPPVSG